MSTGSGLRVRWDRVILLSLVLISTITLVVTAVVSSASPPAAEAPAPAPTPPAAVQAAVSKPKPCSAPTRRVLRTAPKVGEPKTVALTFDDGPGAATDKVLKILQDKQVRATFFVIGRQAASHPERVRRAVAAGHAVENHSWSHPTPPVRNGWRTATITKQITRTQSELATVTGQAPCFFRPPGGVTEGASRPTYAAHTSTVLWSVDTRDWAHPRKSQAPAIRKSAREGLKQPHPIVLLHDGGGDRAGTLAALPGIIDDYRSHGYVFVTIDGRK